MRYLKIRPKADYDPEDPEFMESRKAVLHGMGQRNISLNVNGVGRVEVERREEIRLLRERITLLSKCMLRAIM